MEPLPDQATVEEARAAAGCSELQWSLLYVRPHTHTHTHIYCSRYNAYLLLGGINQTKLTTTESHQANRKRVARQGSQNAVEEGRRQGSDCAYCQRAAQGTRRRGPRV